MEIKDIRPIPKYMLEKIKKADKSTTPNGKVRFYTYFTKFKGELCSVTVAVKNYYKRWYCKQVVVHGIHSDKVYLQDIGMSMGFLQVGWYRDGLSKYKTWHDYDWGWNDDKYFPMHSAQIINLNYILTLPEYKYSAVDKYKYTTILKYLRLYEKYPQCEYLVKMGLCELATSIQVLEKCRKDKNFCKWLAQNKDELSKHYYYVTTVIRAYNQKADLKRMQAYDQAKKNFKNARYRKQIETLFNGNLTKFLDYISAQETNINSYMDYLNACEYLGIDITLDKNLTPHNFKRWHDIRIDEYRTAKAMKDAEERKQLIEKFMLVASKYTPLQHGKGGFICIIAKSPQDLINEGEILHHCVGRMNYDQRFIREESLIFFVRNEQTPEIPFVTLEYSLRTKKVLQCYGEHDSKPDEKVLNYVNKVWLPYANRNLKKIAA